MIPEPDVFNGPDCIADLPRRPAKPLKGPPPANPQPPKPIKAALPKGDLTKLLIPLPIFLRKPPNPYNCLGSCILPIVIILSKFKVKAGVDILKILPYFIFEGSSIRFTCNNSSQNRPEY